MRIIIKNNKNNKKNKKIDESTQKGTIGKE